MHQPVTIGTLVRMIYSTTSMALFLAKGPQSWSMILRPENSWVHQLHSDFFCFRNRDRMSEWDWDHWDHLSQAVRSRLVVVSDGFCTEWTGKLSVTGDQYRFKGVQILGAFWLGEMKPTHRQNFVRGTWRWIELQTAWPKLWRRLRMRWSRTAQQSLKIWYV